MGTWTVIEPAAPTRDPEDLLDSHDVAKMLSVNVSWVKNHCSRFEPFLPHVKLGSGRRKMLRFKREQVLKFIDEHMVLKRV